MWDIGEYRVDGEERLFGEILSFFSSSSCSGESTPLYILSSVIFLIGDKEVQVGIRKESKSAC